MAIWEISKWHGGISTGDKVGIDGSFLYGQNLDIISDPDKLQIMPKTVKDSGSVVVDLPMFMMSEGVNNDIYAIGSTGKFYKRTAGAWSLLRILGGGNAQGGNYFNGLIYFASGNRLGTYNPSGGAFNESYQTLNTSDWHPCVPFMDKIVIGNEQTLAYVDGSSIWDSDVLTIDNDYRIKSLEVIGGGNWLAIGTEKLDKADAKLFLWDGFSTNYNEVITIKENGINAIVNSDSIVLIQAGARGNLYQCTGTSLALVKAIPLVGSGLTAKAYPGAVCNHLGDPLIGISEGTSTTVNRGIFSWTSAEKNYPKVLNMAYTPSHGNLTGTTRQIGSMYSEGETQLYIGWRSGSDYGIDLVDGTACFAIAEYQSRIFDAGVPQFVKFFSDFKIRLARPLRTGEKIDFYIDKDRSGSWTQLTDLTMDYAVDGAIIEKSADTKQRANELQIRIVLSSSSGTSPAVAAFFAEFQVESLL